MAAALTVTQLFDSLAIQIDAERAWGTRSSVQWKFTDSDETYRMELTNGTLIHYPTKKAEAADQTITLTKPELLGMLAGRGTEGIQIEGEPDTFSTILSYLDKPQPGFAIVTP